MTAPSVEAILLQHPFFEDIEPKYIQEISEHAVPMRFATGQHIFRHGEAAHQFFLIRQGLVGLEVFKPAQRAVPLMTIGAGDVLGWSWLFPPYVWHLDANAIQETELIALDGLGLRQQCELNHELGYHIMRHSIQIIEQRFQAALMQLMDLYEQ